MAPLFAKWSHFKACVICTTDKVTLGRFEQTANSSGKTQVAHADFAYSDVNGDSGLVNMLKAWPLLNSEIRSSLLAIIREVLRNG